jgi:hypothetical protein
MLLTLPMSNSPFNKSYPEYLGLGLMLVGFALNNFQTARGCHHGKYFSDYLRAI